MLGERGSVRFRTFSPPIIAWTGEGAREEISQWLLPFVGGIVSVLHYRELG